MAFGFGTNNVMVYDPVSGTIQPTPLTIDNAGNMANAVIPVAQLSGTLGTNQLPSVSLMRLASYDQSSLSATQTGITLIASLPTTALYQITGYLKKTTAATTSSTLGPLTITYTDGGDSTSLTPTLAWLTSAGAIATSNATNSATVTGLNTIVPFTFYGKTGTGVTFTLTYTSSGATAMVYEAHICLETC